MQCCVARNVHILFQLNRLHILKISNCYYTSILENYLSVNKLSRIEMQLIYSYKSFSTTLISTKTSLSDFVGERKNKDTDAHKKHSGINKEQSSNLDNFVISISKSRINRQQRKRPHNERRKFQNLTHSSPDVAIEPKKYVVNDKDFLESESQNINKGKVNDKKSQETPTIISKEKNVLENDYKIIIQNRSIPLKKIENAEKFKHENYNELYQNNTKENRRLQSLNHSSERKVSKHEKNINDKVCMICTSVLQEFIDSNQYEYAFSSLKEYQKQDITPAFPILESLAYWGGHNGRPDVVKTAEAVARNHFNSIFKKNLNFENHLAISYMKSGEVTESFAVLEKFLCTNTHKMYPKISKKKKDTLALIMNFLPMKEKSIIEEAEVFVNKIIEKTGRVIYALPLWKVCFISKDFNCQQVADSLLKRHPSLVLMLGQKVRNIVEKAESEDDLELLYSLLQLLLRHDLQQYLVMPTQGILKIQCESNDISMAHETLLFAKRLNISLEPQLAASFHKVIKQYRQRPRIFPRPPPTDLPKIPPTPTIKFKF